MNYKIRVNNEAESKEVQELFQQLGYNRRPYLLTNERMHNDGYPDDYEIGFLFAEVSGYISCANKTSTTFFTDHRFKEITIQQLKDLVVLKRNDIQDATHTSYSKFYYLTNNEFYEYIGGKWVNVDEFVDGLEFKVVNRDNIVDHLTQLQCVQDNLIKKEYLIPLLDGDYELVKSNSKIKESWIEVPEGANIYAINDEVGVFYKDDGNTQFDDVEWKPCDGVGLVVYNNLKKFLRFGDGGKVVWERQNDIEEPTTEDNQIIVDTQTIVDVNPIFGHSDLFDKIRKGEIIFDFSEMKTEREGELVENPQPSKPSELFKDDCERDSNYPKMKAERMLCVKVDEFSEVNDKQIEWVKSRVKSNGDNRKAITVTITPNDVKVKWFKKFLDGVKVQCRVIGTKGWQNMTWKSLEKMKLNIEFREKPTTVEVDGMKFDTVDKLTSYLKSMTNLK